MPEIIWVDDKKLASENLDTLTDTIYDQVKHQKNNPSKKEIKKMPQKIQEIVNEKDLTQEERQKKLQICASTMFKGGQLAVSVAGYADTTMYASTTAVAASRPGVQGGTMYAMTGLAAAGTWAVAGIVAVRKSGLDYRKYKKGEMSED